MIGYVTLGTNDLARGVKFYDALAALLDTPRMMEGETYVAWGTMDGGAGIGLMRPHDGNPATVGNGVMVALQARDEAHVREIYETALTHGGSDEGAPGLRDDSFYAAYFRDPDGNKLNAFTFVQAQAG